METQYEYYLPSFDLMFSFWSEGRKTLFIFKMHTEESRVHINSMTYLHGSGINLFYLQLFYKIASKLKNK